MANTMARSLRSNGVVPIMDLAYRGDGALFPDQVRGKCQHSNGCVTLAMLGIPVEERLYRSAQTFEGQRLAAGSPWR
jgi:hypothetical protein